MKIFLGLLISLCFVGLSTSKFTCQDCVTFWNNLRRNIGCNNQTNSVCVLVEQIFFVSSTVCQKSIDAICRKGCEADPNRCAFVACGLLKYCNSTTDRKILGIDNYQRTVSEHQIGKINSRDIVNEFKGEKETETDDTDDNDFDDDEEEETDVEETKQVEKKQDDSKVESREGAVTEGHIGQGSNQEDKPRVVLVVVHEEVHDIVYVQIPLMEHLKMILVRARQQMCAFFARIRARLFRHSDSSHTYHTPDSHPVDPQHQVEKPQPRQTQPQQHMHEAQNHLIDPNPHHGQQDQNPHNHHMQQMHTTHVAEEEKFVH